MTIKRREANLVDLRWLEGVENCILKLDELALDEKDDESETIYGSKSQSSHDNNFRNNTKFLDAVKDISLR